MRANHHGRRRTPRLLLAIVTPISLLIAGVLAATPATAATAVPNALAQAHSAHAKTLTIKSLTKAKSAPAKSVRTRTRANWHYACGDTFKHGKFNCMSIKNTAAHPTALAVKPGAIPSGTGLSPTQLQAAYNLTSAAASDGSGTTVAIVDAYNDPTAASDLAAYRSAAGLPALTSGQFTVYNQTGATSPLPATAPSTDDWTLEESLDVDMVSAICPLCKIDLVEADDDTGNGLYIAEQTAATTLGAKYISNSWGGSESSSDTSSNSQYFGQSGVVYTASSGDGAYSAGVIYPATSPNVVSVGGTTLNTSTNSRGWTESVWGTSSTEGTGSGCSAYEPRPSWQSSVSTITGACSYRADNDVAADADPNTGAAIYDTSNSNGGWNQVGGTSESSPIIAATFALAGNNGNGGTNAAESIYNNTGSLNEVTGGSNGSCSPSVLCTATGAANTWNGPTGWGTPNGLTAFQSTSGTSGGGGTGNTVTVTNPGSQSGTVGTAASLQISASDSASASLTYTATGLPAGLSINSSTGLISGTPTTAGSSSVTVSAADSTGASGSASFTWTISSSSGGGGTGCTAKNLLVNGGFDTGSLTPWAGTSGVLASTADGVPAQSGSYLAWMDGYGTAHTDAVEQTVTIPASCTTATLNFWAEVNSTSTNTNNQLDVGVFDSSGNLLASGVAATALDSSSSYSEYSADLSAYAGQTITIEFAGYEVNDGYNTQFFEDSNSLNVS